MPPRNSIKPQILVQTKQQQLMQYQPGDIVWVPASILPNNYFNQQCEYIPAKFLKHTNRLDICMVSLYQPKCVNSKDQQFLVDTDQILTFKSHRINNPGPQLLYAYENALKDFNNQTVIENTKKGQLISNSAQFCEYIEKLFIAQILPRGKEQINRSVPTFGNSDLPLQKSDICTYFEKKIAMKISFLIQKDNYRQAKINSFLKQTKNKIIERTLQVFRGSC